MKKAFTLIEMLVVIGIIAVLSGAMMAGFTKFTAKAEKAKCQELVSNVSTALNALYVADGAWPLGIRKLSGVSKDAKLDEKGGYVLASAGYMNLTTVNGQLGGLDKFGILDPWGAAYLKARGSKATLGSKLDNGSTLEDHILHIAVDLDGDGKIEGASVGGESVDVRASAIVWCAGKDGKMERYSQGLKKDDVYSWTKGQTRDVR